MSDHNTKGGMEGRTGAVSQPSDQENHPRKPLSPAAERALAEAAERRRLAEQQQAERAKEHGGRDGPEPVRYGDWERDGIISDF